MNDDADRFAGQVKSMWPWRAETGEKYLRACAAYDHLIAQKTDHVGGSPNDELAEVKEAWSGLIPGAADAEEVDSRTDNTDGTTTFVHESMHLTFTREEMAEADKPAEQSWEKQARVAAAAGYAHVAPEEDEMALASHLGRMGVIRDGNKNLFTKSYARTQPPAPLSGMRSINGWAVSGFAVTDDGFAQTYGPVRDCHAATQIDAMVMLRNHARGGGPWRDMTPADWRARAKSPNFTDL